MPKMIPIPEFLLGSIEPSDLIAACVPRLLRDLILEQDDRRLAELLGAPPEAQPSPPKKKQAAPATKAQGPKTSPERVRVILETTRGALGSAPRSVEEIAREVDAEPAQVKRALAKLIESGDAAKEGSGRWTKYTRHPSKLNGHAKAAEAVAS